MSSEWWRRSREEGRADDGGERCQSAGRTILCESVAKARSLCSVCRDSDWDKLNPTLSSECRGPEPTVTEDCRTVPLREAVAAEPTHRPLERMTAVIEGLRR